MSSSRSRGRCVVLAVLLLGLALWAIPGTLAQQPAAGPPAADAGPAVSSVRRVPTYFGQLGLSDLQRERIYEIRHQYRVKILELERRLAAAKAEEMAACEAVLSEGQLRLLQQRRAAGRSLAAAPATP